MHDHLNQHFPIPHRPKKRCGGSSIRITYRLLAHQLPRGVADPRALHNDFVRAFEASQSELMAVPSPELHRFLRGAQAWMAGGIEWHGSSDRYQ